MGVSELSERKGIEARARTFIAALVLSVKVSRPVSDMMNSDYKGECRIYG